jgi:hypothetical protein
VTPSHKVRQRHSDWHKLVPKALLERPPLWRGPALPSSSKDDDWRRFRAEVADFEHKKLEQLKRDFNIPYDVHSDRFYVDLAMCLVTLFPAFQTLAESRGRKRQSLVEPESAVRSVKRDSKKKRDRATK